MDNLLELEGWSFFVNPTKMPYVVVKHSCGVEYHADLYDEKEMNGQYIWYNVIQHVC